MLDELRVINNIKSIIMKRKLLKKIIPESYLVGNFRLSGEAHLCMYDQYLLSSVLTECRFSNIERVNAKESRIESWGDTLLDSDMHGNLDCPASLFMEAVKMPQSTISQEDVTRV